MYPHLQAILTEIEREAENQSRIAAANADTIERAGEIVDTLNRGHAHPVADMCLHWHYDPDIKITIQASVRSMEQAFAGALRGAGIDTAALREEYRHTDYLNGGDYLRLELEKNIAISIAVETLTAPMKEAA